MAIIRKDLKQGEGPGGVFEGICENLADFAGGLPTWGTGSLLYCVQDGGLYIKNAEGGWTEVNPL